MGLQDDVYVLGLAVDLLAYLIGLVDATSIPSVVVRVVLGGVFFGRILQKTRPPFLEG